MDSGTYQEALRRRRELYTIRRANETPLEAEERRRRQREYARRRCAQITERQRQENYSQSTQNQYVIYTSHYVINFISDSDIPYSHGAGIEQPQASNTETDQSPEYPHIPQLQLNDPTVITKIKGFYDDLASLQQLKCLLCNERFPSICLNEANCCTRCHNDTHVPKLFSAANNMDPGSVPPQLTVSPLNIHNQTTSLFYYIGIVRSRADAYFSCTTTYVHLLLTTWTIWI